MNDENSPTCEQCGERDAFDLYLGEWVCRQCKQETREREYDL